MIFTKEWLKEWIDIEKIDIEDICATLNSIGLEVDSLHKIQIPKSVVVAKVLTCKKHPDADKLNVCEVDLGDEKVQIVCGAKNVAAGQYVAVSKVGAQLPGGLIIKEAKLRGQSSSGMICSSEELGLPKMGDGIMVLDESIGKLVIGKELCEYSKMNDEIVEIELTANRGDCLSVYGVARDLSVPYELELASFESEDEEHQLGIGRVLNVIASEKNEASLLYRAYESKDIHSPLIVDLRLAFADAYKDTDLQRLVEYATYTTGVLIRAYSHECFASGGEKATVRIKKHGNGLDGVYGVNSHLASFVGISQNCDTKPKSDDTKVILEANYTHPDIISINSANKKLESDRHLYRSSRGSEPNLDFGMDYMVELLKSYCDVKMYAGSQQINQESEEKRIPIDLAELAAMIGEEIPKNRIIQILKGLGFDVIFKTEQSVMNVKVPLFRPDVLNAQDVCEEIVRMVGIDNIQSKALVFAEQQKINDAYLFFKQRQALRHKAVGVGFYETLHFVFDDRQRVERYGLKTVYKKREIANPITNELDTLRPSLIPNLLDSVSRNVKFGKKSIPLFEIGSVFDRSRDESVHAAFVFSGALESERVSNHGKPQNIDLFSFAQKISNIIGEFELQSESCPDNLCSPYEYAKVIYKSKDIGYIGRVHLQIERDLDIPRSYICEIDLAALPRGMKEASAYSKFPVSTRDVSLLVPKDMAYLELKKYIQSISDETLIHFFPMDIYEDESLGDKMSLTLKLQFQSAQKTLEDDEVVQKVQIILDALEEKFGISIR